MVLSVSHGSSMQLAFCILVRGKHVGKQFMVGLSDTFFPLSFFLSFFLSLSLSLSFFLSFFLSFSLSSFSFLFVLRLCYLPLLCNVCYDCSPGRGSRVGCEHLRSAHLAGLQLRTFPPVCSRSNFQAVNSEEEFLYLLSGSLDGLMHFPPHPLFQNTGHL